VLRVESVKRHATHPGRSRPQSEGKIGKAAPAALPSPREALVQSKEYSAMKAIGMADNMQTGYDRNGL
jgi:hypothetical protein